MRQALIQMTLFHRWYSQHAQNKSHQFLACAYVPRVLIFAQNSSRCSSLQDSSTFFSWILFWSTFLATSPCSEPCCTLSPPPPLLLPSDPPAFRPLVVPLLLEAEQERLLLLLDTAWARTFLARARISRPVALDYMCVIWHVYTYAFWKWIKVLLVSRR